VMKHKLVDASAAVDPTPLRRPASVPGARANFLRRT